MRRQYISRYNITDINFIVINAGDIASRRNHYRLRSLGHYDLYQDNAPRSHPETSQLNQEESVWNLLNGDKDDFLIYDRCGQLTYHIPLPYSALKYPFVQIAIESTYTGRHPCNCSADSPTTTVTPTEKTETTVPTSTTPVAAGPASGP